MTVICSKFYVFYYIELQTKLLLLQTKTLMFFLLKA